MPSASDDLPWTQDTRRVPATAIGGVRPRPTTDAVPPPQRRPFTSMGSSLFDLEAARATNQLEPVRSNQRSSKATASGEFDVRKFLLDQKGAEPLHTTALFRGALETATTVGSSSKKRLPRMDLPKTSRQAAPPLTISQPLDDPTVSHFYTIEKLSESCFHAVQSKHSKTWQFLPGAEERSKSCSGVSANASSGGANSLTNVERPSRRVDVLDLEKCFDLAMQCVHKTTTRSDMGTSTDPQRTTIERDVLTIQAHVVHRYSSPNSQRHDALGQPPSAPEDADAVDARHKRLARTLFEQKWSDVVLGEIEAMLTKSFLEQGALLRTTRERYAKSFFKLEKLYHQSTLELATAREELHATREELRLASATHELDTQLMKTQYEDEITRLSVGFESRREEMEKKMTESKEQMTKMGDTMKTLNTIFRQMREDTDKVKAVELRENYIKLEKKFETCREEVERLRPLVLLNHQLHEQKDGVIHENRALKEKIANFDAVAASKDEMIATLMAQQSELLAAQELQAAEDDERRRLDEARAAEEEEEEDYDDTNESRRQPISQRPGGRGSVSAAVCVRCKENLRTQSQGGGLVTVVSTSQADESEATLKDSAASNGGLSESRRKRVQCMYFRILLPNLRGRRPQRELAWTLSCMRSIMFAKQLDDAMCKTSGGAFPLRIRMPEFVYSWFSPWRSLRDEKTVPNVDGDGDPEDDPAALAGDSVEIAGRRAALNESNKERTEEQRQQQADEDRWCLYYGVKALVQEGYLEAKLFLSLLDEKYGEDEQVFMLYCYRVLDVLLGGKIQWGPFRDAVSYEQFAAQYEHELGPGRPSSSDPLKTIHAAGRVPKIIWISPYHASLATSIVLCKATEMERAALDKKLLAFAVTNLPAQDRPSVYLTPANASQVRDCVDERKLRPPPPNETADTADAPLLQFVDANLWVELMMMEYKEEQAHRRAAIRLMFQTATSMSSSLLGSFGGGRAVLTSVSTMDMEQFRIMIRTLNDDLPSFMIATLFRAAFMRGNGAVTFDSFLEAAEYAQFFSSCMRLENPVASMARLAAESGRGGDPLAPSHAALSTGSRAAFVVDKYFTLMHNQLIAMTAVLPIWTRSLVDSLMYELSSALVDENGSSSGGSALADGVQLLASFHRLLAALLLSTLAKKDATGGVLSSKSIFSFEKAIQAVLDCVRVGDKTTVEQLIDAVRQNLSVKRVQGLFRKHIQRDLGAPLVMRSLFHPSYGKGQRGPLSARQVERPLQWVLFVIADVLRRSLRFDSVQCLLLELSTVSSVLQQSGSTSSARSSLTRDVNGGIGACPKPLLVELLYDSFVEWFGTRGEAEKLLHDVFVNCRAILARDDDHPRVRLFAYLCCLSHAHASPDDRLMSQNEALAFLQAVLRCGLHAFHLTHPPPVPVPDDDTGPTTQDDHISQTAAEGILVAAFAKLGTDQQQRMKMRLDEQLTIWKTPGLSDMPTQMLSGSFALKSDLDLTPKQFMNADAFLLLALHEWKRYIQLRMNELRVVCCSMEDEIAPFGTSLPLDTIATMLQKADVSFNNEELCAVFRRVCLTEHHDQRGISEQRKHHTSAGASWSTSKRTAMSGSDHQLRPVDHMSDRLAAACFPLLARETLVELRRLEHASPTPFKVPVAVDDKAKFLVESWRAYEAPCSVLLDELRRVGKNNDIKADAVSRRVSINGGRAIKREVLYLSTSSSSDTLSSQDVAQLEALHTLFLERLEKMNEELSKPPQPPDANENRRKSMKLLNELATSSRRMSVQASGSAAPLVFTEEAKEALVNSRGLLVNETWKMFRQLLVMYSRLRTLAGLGDGPLPDKWDAIPEPPSAPASA